MLARPIRTNRGLQKTCTGTQCHFPHRASRSAPPEPIWSKSAKSSDSRGGLEGQFGDGFRRKQDPNADPTDTQLRASIYGVYGPCALVSGPESCDPERSGSCWWLEGVVTVWRHLGRILVLIGGKMDGLTTPSPQPAHHYTPKARSVAVFPENSYRGSSGRVWCGTEHPLDEAILSGGGLQHRQVKVLACKKGTGRKLVRPRSPPRVEAPPYATVAASRRRRARG